MASPEGSSRDPELVWKFYSLRREQAKTVEPDAGHLALAEAEKRLGDHFLLVTQKVTDFTSVPGPSASSRSTAAFPDQVLGLRHRALS